VTTVDKGAAKQRLEEEWQALNSLVESFSAEEMQAPGVVEDWSVKDLLGHMAFWANKAAHDLDAINAGDESAIQLAGGQEGIDAWNARESEARKGKSLKDVKREWEESYEAASRALDKTAPELLEREVGGYSMFVRFREDTYNHYKEHAEQIRDWKRNVETTEE
jgi:uncharacterized protein (TIGR03083 family)